MFLGKTSLAPSSIPLAAPSFVDTKKGISFASSVHRVDSDDKKQQRLCSNNSCQRCHSYRKISPHYCKDGWDTYWLHICSAMDKTWWQDKGRSRVKVVWPSYHEKGWSGFPKKGWRAFCKEG